MALSAASWGRACRTCRSSAASGRGGTCEGPAQRCNGPQVTASGVAQCPQDKRPEKLLHRLQRGGGGGGEKGDDVYVLPCSSLGIRRWKHTIGSCHCRLPGITADQLVQGASHTQQQVMHLELAQCLVHL